MPAIQKKKENKPVAKVTHSNKDGSEGQTSALSRAASHTAKRNQGTAAQRNPDLGKSTKATIAKGPSASKPAAKKGTSKFGKAFAAARKSGAKTLSFGGKSYNTKTKDEK